MEPSCHGRGQESVQLFDTILKAQVFPKQCHGRGWGRRKEYKVSDFLRPHTPTLTYPASHTAPFPSSPPTDEKVCHQRTHATFPGGVETAWAPMVLEISKLPSNEGQPLRTMTWTSLSQENYRQTGTVAIQPVGLG